MKKFINDILTGVDKTTYDVGRVMGLGGFIGFHVMGLIAALTGHMWSAMEYSGGLSTILGSIGLHLKLKSDTEPSA